MKIALVLLPAVSSLETSTSSAHLLAAVGSRNVTKMEALVQGLADESVQEPGWKFDKDIQAALEAIRSTFVGGIQKSLLEAQPSLESGRGLAGAPLVAGALLAVENLTLGDTLADVGALLLKGDLDTTCIAVKALVGVIVADLVDDTADE